MADTFEVANGPVRLRVEGLRTTVRDLERAGADSQDMKTLIHEIGMIVVKSADVPSLTGTLAGTLRAGRGKTKAVVRAGGARAPYAGVRHYGWPARNIDAAPFLLDAVQSERGEILDTLDQGIDQILVKNNLK